MRCDLRKIVMAVLLAAPIAEASREESRAPSPDVDSSILSSLVPTNVVARTAGYLGMLAAGPEYVVADGLLGVGLIYGYTPNRHGGSGAHSLALTADLFPYRWNATDSVSVAPYLHFAPVVALNGPFHVLTSSIEPAGYYQPNRILEILGAGVSSDFKALGGEVFVESSLLSTDIAMAGKLRKIPWRSWSISMGLRHHIRPRVSAH